MVRKRRQINVPGYKGPERRDYRDRRHGTDRKRGADRRVGVDRRVNVLFRKVVTKTDHMTNNDVVALIENSKNPAEQLLKKGLNAKELEARGFNAKQLLSMRVEDLSQPLTSNADTGEEFYPKKDCFRLESLKKLGFSAAKLLETGVSHTRLKHAYSLSEMRQGGLTARQLYQYRRPPGFFSAQELKEAGFTVRELKDASFNCYELKRIGFSARDLIKAGFSSRNLLEVGFSPAQIKKALN